LLFAPPAAAVYIEITSAVSEKCTGYLLREKKQQLNQAKRMQPAILEAYWLACRGLLADALIEQRLPAYATSIAQLEAFEPRKGDTGMANQNDRMHPG
jgi:hypothetical protein